VKAMLGVLAALVMVGSALVVERDRAGATPASGARGTVLSTGRLPGGFSLKTRHASQFTFQQVTIDPGGKTGWHTHPGRLLVVVASGELTRVQAHGCRTHVYRKGDAFIERGGNHDVHQGLNLGSEPVVLHVLYVTPTGHPLRNEASAPSC